MRVVLDTNVLISGLIRPGGPPGRIVAAWREGQFELALSEPLVEELQRVLRYPKMRASFAQAGLSDDDLRDFVDLLRMKAVVVEVSGVTLEVAPQDAQDRPVVATLIASGAEWLVTGDKRDLLSLGLTRIVSAREFLPRVESLRMPPLAEQPRAPYSLSRQRRKRQAVRAAAGVGAYAERRAR